MSDLRRVHGDARMLTFVWRTDAHLADQAPASRTDDWAETVLGKLQQVGEIARSVKADAVFDGGDLTHIKSPTRNSHRLVRRIAEVQSEYPCPTYCCPGNHDPKYGDYANIGEGPLGVLFGAGVLRRLYDEHEALFESGGVSVRVAGIPYHGVHYDLNRVNTITKGKETHLVVVAHLLASAAGGSMFEGEDILKYNDLANLDPDVYCLGHWHKDQGVQVVGGKTFVNIGSLSRGALSVDELTRKPSVAILRFDKKGVDVEVRHLDVEPPENVLDLDRRVRAEVRDMSMDTFVDSIRTTLKGRADESLLAKVRAMSGLPDEVRERAISHLEKAGAK